MSLEGSTLINNNIKVIDLWDESAYNGFGVVRVPVINFPKDVVIISAGIKVLKKAEGVQSCKINMYAQDYIQQEQYPECVLANFDIGTAEVGSTPKLYPANYYLPNGGSLIIQVNTITNEPTEGLIRVWAISLDCGDRQPGSAVRDRTVKTRGKL